MRAVCDPQGAAKKASMNKVYQTIKQMNSEVSKAKTSYQLALQCESNWKAELARLATEKAKKAEADRQRREALAKEA